MNEENIKSEDYIDLPPLKKITIQFLSFIFSTLELFIQVFKSGKLLLLAGLISGLGVGFAYYSSRPVYYEISMIAESSDLYKKTVSEMIKSLNELIASGSYPKLSDELGISESNSKSISFIDLTNLNNDPIEKDTSTKFNQPFKILARISNPQLTDTFQTAITRYLNGKRTLKRIKTDQVKFYQEKLSFIEKELAKLDTLKTEYNHFLALSKITTTYYSNDFDPATIYVHSNDLVDEKGTIMYWLSKNAESIIVIDEFKSPAFPQSYSLKKSLTLGALAGLLFSFLLALFRELYKKTRRFKGSF